MKKIIYTSVMAALVIVNVSGSTNGGLDGVKSTFGEERITYVQGPTEREVIPGPTQMVRVVDQKQVDELNKRIAELEAELAKLKGLYGASQSARGILDGQVKANESKIAELHTQIQNLQATVARLKSDVTTAYTQKNRIIQQLLAMLGQKLIGSISNLTKTLKTGVAAEPSILVKLRTDKDVDIPEIEKMYRTVLDELIKTESAIQAEIDDLKKDPKKNTETIEILREKLKTTTEAKTALQKQLDEFKQAKADAESAIAQLEGKIQVLTKASKDKETEIERLKKELEEAKTSATSEAQKQADELARVKAELEEAKKANETELERLKKELKAAKASGATATSEAQKQAEELAGVKAELEKAKKAKDTELERLQKELEEAKATQATAASDAKQQAEELAEVKAELDKAKKAAANAETQLETAKVSADDAAKKQADKLAKLQAQIAQLEKAKKDAEDAKAELETAKVSADDAAKQQAEELATLRAQIAQLKRAKEETEKAKTDAAAKAQKQADDAAKAAETEFNTLPESKEFEGAINAGLFKELILSRIKPDSTPNEKCIEGLIRFLDAARQAKDEIGWENIEALFAGATRIEYLLAYKAVAKIKAQGINKHLNELDDENINKDLWKSKADALLNDLRKELLESKRDGSTTINKVALVGDLVHRILSAAYNRHFDIPVDLVARMYRLLMTACNPKEIRF